MDQSSDLPALPCADAAPVRRAPGLALVSSPLRLARDAEPVPQSWSAALAELAGFLGIDTAFVPAPDTAAPVFSPWSGWSATAFQNGGCKGLPQAQFVASYCIDHASDSGQQRGGVDIALISPHPAVCDADAAHLPGTGTLRAMIRAAAAEGRERIAIICHAHQSSLLAALRLGEDRSLCGEGQSLEILAIDDALPALMTPGAQWGAIIAMPDLRSIIFTLLSETSGVRGPWPLLWHNRGLRRVTCEVKCDGSILLPLDAPALIHTLALALKAAGKGGAALQLHVAWAELRERGVTTAARGSDAPYATEVADAEFITLLRRDSTAARRAPVRWQALESSPRIISGSQKPTLCVISAKLAN